MNIGSMLDRSARRWPQKLAVIDGENAITYQELARRSNKIAIALNDGYHIQKGDRVVFICHNRLEGVETFYGIVKAGAIYVGLNFRLDWQEYLTILDNCAPAVVMYDSAFSDLADRIRCDLHVPCINIDDDMSEYAEAVRSAPNAQPMNLNDMLPDDNLTIVYTSGTTGTPKGILQTHRIVLHQAAITALEFSFDPDTNYLLCLPHYTGCNTAYVPVLMVGGSITMMDTRGFDGADFCEKVNSHKITHTYIVPTQLYRILAHLKSAAIRIESMQMIGFGGGPVRPDRLLELFQLIGPKMQQLYGMNEITSAGTIFRRSDYAAAISAGRFEILESAGKPSFVTNIRIVDQNNDDLPVGMSGEILIGTPCLMKGYYSEPDRTAKVMVDDVYLRTGDIGRFDADGYLYIEDRVKDLIIRGGHNIASREIERRLEEHKAVSQAAVVGVPDEHWGESVVAFVVRVSGLDTQAPELRDWCSSGGLSSIKLPDQFYYVDELPLNLMGKVAKAALRESAMSSTSQVVSPGEAPPST